jgi:hypothetical protein
MPDWPAIPGRRTRKNWSKRWNRIRPAPTILPIPPDVGDGGGCHPAVPPAQHLEHAPREGERMATKKTASAAPALRITLPDGSSVVGSQASLAKILELTLFRVGHAPVRQPAVRVASQTRRAA